ncbi:hypothetical protein M9458_035492, partial [Cirrhinus mrigala]
TLWEMAEHCTARVWIIGSSYIHRLHAYICERGLGRNLGLPCRITWDGRGGRRWEHLIPVLRSLRARSVAPDLLVIHLGGNSLCSEGRNRVDLLQLMMADMAEIFWMFPHTKILFSDILPRQNWRGQQARSSYGIEKSRRWLNSAIGMSCIYHRNIGLAHLIEDGVHLNSEGNELLLENFREALRSELQK